MKLEVGMYVRTTYGIGKIINAYIVYSDDGALWHLAYMTDNPKIEIGVYTKELGWNLFGEVQKKHKIKYEPIENNLDLVNKVYEQELDDFVCYVPVNNKYPRCASLYDDHKFIKASNNIIDLIEEGDYVNGYKITSIEEGNHKNRWIYAEDDDGYLIKSIPPKNIKSIVTKEQFESMQYKVD